jgi:hypothetical protein
MRLRFIFPEAELVYVQAFAASMVESTLKHWVCGPFCNPSYVVEVAMAILAIEDEAQALTLEIAR